MEIMKNFRLTGAEDRPFLYDLYYRPDGEAKPLVIFTHGFKGFKDWGAWDLIARAFVKAGFAFLKFNLSHNGTTPEAPLDFADLEAFGYNNYSKELKDLEAVLNWAGESKSPELDVSKIALIGHSRGGALSIIKAAHDSRVKAVATWASVSSLDYSWKQNPALLEQWKETGVWSIFNGRTGQEMPLYYQLVEDYQKNEAQQDVQQQLNKLKCPFLIVHGMEDPGVPVESAHQLHEWYPASELHLIEGADHVFSARHPFESEQLPEHSLELVATTISFLKRHFG